MTVTRPFESERSTVRNGDVELAVYTAGVSDGPTLVLVHGWPDNHTLWNHVVGLLADRYRVVTYDSRGAGDSTVPARTRGYRLDAMASDLRAVIDAVSPDAPVHVLGHDWGAVEAWELVAEADAPLRISSYTSVSGPNLDHLALWARSRLRRPTPRNLAQVFAQTRASWYTVTFHVPPLARVRMYRMKRKGWTQFIGEFSDVPAAMVEESPTLLDDAWNGLSIYRANLLPRFTSPRRRYVTVPVHLIVNTRDAAVRPFHYEDTPRWVADLSRTDLDAGHWSPLSHPWDIARITSEFVDGIESRRQTAST
ncbi:alpha/beta fold hydrolase [Rhodococcus sp. BP-316]|uniref:alpha/beta fold hydrolase n=1 Tax=Rhodococcus sp. BP-316 TaxID=2739445 RepID=UPI001C9A70DD|nr:alpha/beta fold hydrolase [Rhodococcus sp. BP-316]MBY6680222.1 alpha/beta fold hydrolase [Rhodococcus sp. BP-316]